MSPAEPKSVAATLKHPYTTLTILGLVIIYLVVNIHWLRDTVRNPDLATKMAAKDSRQYVEIGQDFARGDFSMSYVNNMPHRQPLYPLALSVAIKFWGDNLSALGAVNIVVGLVLLVCLYFGLLRYFGSQVTAIITCLCFIGNPFMIDKISCRLMTEPLHALTLIVLILFFLFYLRRGRISYLIGMAVMAGLDYLDRPNGLFVAAATIAAVIIYDVLHFIRPTRGETPADRLAWKRTLLGYACAMIAFVIVSAPSWIPRYVYFKKPIYHGYLSNFMWVDTYEQGHTGQARVDFSWKDYAKTHGMSDFLHRWGTGFYNVFYEFPRHTERVRVLYLLALIGIVVAVAKRRVEFWFLFGLMFVQLLPMVWTNEANPGPRVPYGTMFPFELFFAALAVYYAIPLITSLYARVSQKSSKEPAAA